MLIRYYGHVGYPSGYGDAGNELCMAILAAGYELEIQTNGTELHARYLPLASCVTATQDLRPPDVVIVHTLPLDCANLLAAERIREQFPEAQCICYTTWEGISEGVSPAFAAAVDHFDMVWVPSTHNLRALLGGEIAATVAVVPHSFDDDNWAERWAEIRARRARQESRPASSMYWFYYIGAWTVRKNVPGLIRAFLGEFTRDDNVGLHIHSPGASSRDFQMAVMSSGIPESMCPTMVFSNERTPTVDAIHEERDCFVTASRGEAWNLPAFQALLSARMIISPVHLGSDDFLLQTRASRCSSSRHHAYGDVVLLQRPDAPPGHGIAQLQIGQGMTSRDLWREPDADILAGLMRTAYVLRCRTLHVDYDIAAQFGRRAVAERIKQLIESEGEEK